MERFRTRGRGYDRVDVDRYIDDMTRKYEERLTAQVERIDSLKMECAMKDKELERYKAKESEIGDALLTAIEKAKEMDYTAKIRFSLEGERIKIFRSKWVNFVNRHRDNLKVQGVKDSMTSYLDAMDREIASVMEKDVGIYRRVKFTEPEEDYLEENERNGEFNLDDLSDPPDLKTICDEIDAN